MLKNLNLKFFIVFLFLGACSQDKMPNESNQTTVLSKRELMDKQKNSFSLYASSGGWTGGGGSGVRCMDEEGVVNRLEVLELYENLFEFEFIQVDLNKTAYENLENLIQEKISPLNAFFAMALLEGLKKVSSVENWVAKQDLSHIDDLGKRKPKDPGCERVQFAYRFIKKDENEQWPEVKIFKNQTLFDELRGKFPPKKVIENKIVITLHEILYYLMAIEGEVVSDAVRPMVLALLNQKVYSYLDVLSSNDPEELFVRGIGKEVAFRHMIGLYNVTVNLILGGQPLSLVQTLTEKELRIQKKYEALFLHDFRFKPASIFLTLYFKYKNKFREACLSEKKTFLEILNWMNVLYNKGEAGQLYVLTNKTLSKEEVKIFGSGLKYSFCKKYNIIDEDGVSEKISTPLTNEYFNYVQREFREGQVDLYNTSSISEYKHKEGEAFNPIRMMFGLPASLEEWAKNLGKGGKDGDL